MKKKNYIPIEQVNLQLLRDDIQRRKRQFSLRALGKKVGLSHIGLYYKLQGQQSFSKSQMDILAAWLGEDSNRYVKDSHSDAAS